MLKCTYAWRLGMQNFVLITRNFLSNYTDIVAQMCNMGLTIQLDTHEC